MRQHYPMLGLGQLCGLFGKSRQAYYDYSWRQSDDHFQKGIILNLVKDIRISQPKIGALKLFKILRQEFAFHNIRIGRDSFLTLLRNNSLLIKRRKKYVRTTNSNHPYQKWPNLIKDLITTAVEQLWVSDITYLETANGFLYLSLITDHYSHKIVGYHLSQNLKARSSIIALNKAICSLKNGASLIHHSDRGIQYCCDAYIEVLKSNKIKISMTESGSPYDNAVAERLNGILKTELGLDKVFISYSTAVGQVHKAIDVYNRLRPHMSCNDLAPELAHRSIEPLIKKWKSKPYCKAKTVQL